MEILILSVGALGDVLRTTFIAQALREKYEGCNPKITWITDKRAIPLFVNNPYINFVVPIEKKLDFKDKYFDLVINLEVSKEICKFVSSLKKQRVIGAFLNEKEEVDYTKDSAYWFDMSLCSKLGLKKADKLKRSNLKTHREIISKMIGIDNYEKYEPFLRLTKKQRDIANKFLKQHNLSRSDLIIGINTGAADTWPKSLPIKKTIKLIEDLYSKYNAQILLFGGPNEIERNKEIKKNTSAPIIDTGCGGDLYEFPALISACNYFITTDSLGLHISLAIKRKTLCLIGPTSPTEIDMYGLGEKIVAKSKEVCTYRMATKDCMNKIDIKEIQKAFDRLLKEKITFLITAFNEPKSVGKALTAILNQKTTRNYNIVLAAPDEPTLNVAREFAKKNKNLTVFKDPGKGKSFVLNLIFKELKTDILILSDGDVWISENSLEEITNLFLDPEIGCLTGRPVPVENKKTLFGYWANFLFESAHRWRKESAQKGFVECSGYLFAFRKNKIKEIPLDVAEDTVIPYYFWEKGYRIGYAENAQVFVKNVTNLRDWIKQKKRTSKAHETLNKYVDTKTTPRVKTFLNEAKGFRQAIGYASNPKELFWTFQLILARFYIWYLVFLETKLKNAHYSDAWERVESTK